jgi:hypothetical protein
MSCVRGTNSGQALRWPNSNARIVVCCCRGPSSCWNNVRSVEFAVPIALSTLVVVFLESYHEGHELADVVSTR